MIVWENVWSLCNFFCNMLEEKHFNDLTFSHQFGEGLALAFSYTHNVTDTQPEAKSLIQAQIRTSWQGNKEQYTLTTQYFRQHNTSQQPHCYIKTAIKNRFKFQSKKTERNHINLFLQSCISYKTETTYSAVILEYHFGSENSYKDQGCIFQCCLFHNKISINIKRRLPLVLLQHIVMKNINTTDGYHQHPTIFGCVGQKHGKLCLCCLWIQIYFPTNYCQKQKACNNMQSWKLKIIYFISKHMFTFPLKVQ